MNQNQRDYKLSDSPYKSILLIWLFIFIGCIIIVWFGSTFMRRVAENDPKAAFYQGKQFYTQGKKEDAMQKFQIAIQSDPANYLAYYYLAKLYWQKNDAEQSLTMLEKYNQNRLGYIIPESISQDLSSLCEQVAKYYISQQNWANARFAYDIAGNSMINVAEYLKRLEQQYQPSNVAGIRDKLWPQGIAVSLENFELAKFSVLSRWVSNPSASIEDHRIVQTPVHNGKQSELLKIKYTTAGPDYWTKNVYLVLQSPLSIRAYVTGKQNTRCQLVANLRYAKSTPEQKVGPTGACFSNEIMLTENQWVPIVIPDVYAEALRIGKDSRFNYNTSLIQLEMVAINTFGNDCEIYLDDIEVCLPK